MEIECMDYKELPHGSFLGFADFYLAEQKIEILGCTVHSKDGKRWVNFPARHFQYEDGRDGYQTMVKFRNPEMYREFCCQSKIILDKFIEKKEEDEQQRST